MTAGPCHHAATSSAPTTFTRRASRPPHERPLCVLVQVRHHRQLAAPAALLRLLPWRLRGLLAWCDMSDDDRLLNYAARVVDDGCSACHYSKVYCRCVAYIEGGDARCCPSCSHGST